MEAFEPELRHHRSEPTEATPSTDTLVPCARTGRVSGPAATATPARRSSGRSGASQKNRPGSATPSSWWRTGRWSPLPMPRRRRELRWIKRSRLFGATRLLWQVTSSGPQLSQMRSRRKERPKTATVNARRRQLSVSAAWTGTAKRLLDKRRAHGREPRPFGTGTKPGRTLRLDDFRLFAVIKSWMDEDIIEATVRNALRPRSRPGLPG